MQKNFRVYDCFTYDGEDCLDLRLKVHWEKVDWFVIVEANVTFTGQPKAYSFDPQKYAWASEKIRYIQLDAAEFSHCKTAWEREEFQRVALRRGYTDARPHDTVIIADVDEILLPEKIGQVETGTCQKFQLLMMYFYRDYLCVSEPLWTRARAVTGEFALSHSAQDIRTRKDVLCNLREITVANSGWHFSYLGGVDAINKKIERFSHQEFNKSKYKDPKKNLQRIFDGKDIYRRAKLWGRVSDYDLGCQAVRDWFDQRPELSAPATTRYGGDALAVVAAYNRRSWLVKKIMRNTLRIWNKL